MTVAEVKARVDGPQRVLLEPVEVQREWITRPARRLARIVLGGGLFAILYALLGDGAISLFSTGLLLIGSETVQATNVNPAAKQQAAQQFECTEEGELEEIHVRSGSATQSAGSTWVAIYADVAGVKPGVVLGKGKTEAAIGKEAWYGIKLTANVKVKKGTKYWLGGVASVSWKLVGTNGGSSVTYVESTESTFTEPTETTLWSGKAKGPASFYGTGTPAGIPETAVPCHGAAHSTVTAAAVIGNVTVASHGAPHSTVIASTYQVATHMAAHSTVVGEALSTALKTHMAAHAGLTAGIAPEPEEPPEADIQHELSAHGAVHSSVEAFAIRGTPSNATHGATHSTVVGFQLPQSANVAHGAAHSTVAGHASAGEVSNITHGAAHTSVLGAAIGEAANRTHGAVHSGVTAFAIRGTLENSTHMAAHSPVVGSHLPQATNTAHGAVHALTSGAAVSGALNVTHGAAHASVAGGNLPVAANVSHAAAHSSVQAHAIYGAASNATHMAAHASVTVVARTPDPPTAKPREPGHVATAQGGMIHR